MTDYHGNSLFNGEILIIHVLQESCQWSHGLCIHFLGPENHLVIFEDSRGKGCQDIETCSPNGHIFDDLLHPVIIAQAGVEITSKKASQIQLTEKHDYV